MKHTILHSCIHLLEIQEKKKKEFPLLTTAYLHIWNSLNYLLTAGSQSTS